MANAARLIDDGRDHRLGQDTAQTLERRREEAEELLTVIRGCPEYSPLPSEQVFLSDMEDKFDRWGRSVTVSGKQIMWLRDIRDKAIRA